MKLVNAAWFVAAVIGGCGGEPDSSPPSDAGADSAGDAGTDAQLLCPDLPGPVVADIDGDGIGTPCDPVESFTFDSPYPIETQGTISRTAAAARTTVSCTSMFDCHQAVFAADEHGKLFAYNDSTATSDAWARGTIVEVPAATADGQILLGRWRTFSESDTVALDVRTATAAPRAMLRLGHALADQAGRIFGALLFDSAGTRGKLSEPRGGTELHEIASAPFDHQFRLLGDPLSGQRLPLTHQGDYLIGVPNGDAAGTFAIRAFRPGANALADLTPPITNAIRAMPVGLYRGSAWCVFTPTTHVLLDMLPTGIRQVPVPACGTATFQLFADTILLNGQEPDVDQDGDTVAAVYVKDGVAHTLVEGASNAYQRMRTFGHDVVVAVLDNSSSSALPAYVWAIYPDGSMQELSTDLSSVSVSVAGSFIHVTGIRIPAGSTQGPLITRRFRPGAAMQEAVVDPSLSLPHETRTVTTLEGAVFVSLRSFGWFAPSTALSFTFNGLGEVAGGPRGAHSVVFSGIPTNATSGLNGAIYVYDEPGGTPRLRRLTSDGRMNATFLDPPRPAAPSEYFVFAYDADPGSVARIELDITGATVLQTVQGAIDRPERMTIVGITRSGELVVGDESNRGTSLFVLRATGAEHLGNGAPNIPILDRSSPIPLFVGWYQSDPVLGRVCVDEQPRRCWAVPPDARVLATHIENAAGPGATVVSMLLYDRKVNTNRFTVLRTIGPGDPGM